MNNRAARILICALSAAALAISILVQNEIISAAAILFCVLASLAILYRLLPGLSGISPDNPKLKTLRFITVFNAAVIISLIIFACLIKNGTLKLNESQLSFIIQAIFAVLIITFGNVSPRIPHNRHTGLRLPWTVADEETWIIAHRLLGYLSLPCGILCFAGAGRPPYSIQVPVAMLFIWILIPAVLSFIFYVKKWRFPKS